ncbi:hypothetical protein AU193_11650 [Mycobacterium sp. GA-1285]|nr:hypothetical protein AU193_11650 [Mycobacterium sp. GA-1285]
MVDQIFFQCAAGKSANAVMSAADSRNIVSTLGELATEHASDGVQLFADVLGVGLGEDGADRRDDHLG